MTCPTLKDNINVNTQLTLNNKRCVGVAIVIDTDARGFSLLLNQYSYVM